MLKQPSSQENLIDGLLVLHARCIAQLADFRMPKSLWPKSEFTSRGAAISTPARSPSIASLLRVVQSGHAVWLSAHRRMQVIRAFTPQIHLLQESHVNSSDCSLLQLMWATNNASMSRRGPHGTKHVAKRYESGSLNFEMLLHW